MLVINGWWLSLLLNEIYLVEWKRVISESKFKIVLIGGRQVSKDSVAFLLKSIYFECLYAFNSDFLEQSVVKLWLSKVERNC